MTHPFAGALVLAVVLGGCEASGPSVRNNLPSPTIAYPRAGDELVEGYPATLRGSVTDTNDRPDGLVATWLAGDEVVCEEAPLAADGSTLCEIVVGEGDDTFTLVTRDPDGAEGSATVEVVTRPNDAPVVTLSLPDGATSYPSDAYVVFEARVSDTEEAADALALAWTDGAGASVDLDTTVDSAGGLTGALLLPAGTHVVTLTATDAPGASGSATVTVEVTEG